MAGSSQDGRACLLEFPSSIEPWRASYGSVTERSVCRATSSTGRDAFARHACRRGLSTAWLPKAELARGSPLKPWPDCTSNLPSSCRLPSSVRKLLLPKLQRNPLRKLPKAHRRQNVSLSLLCGPLKLKCQRRALLCGLFVAESRSWQLSDAKAIKTGLFSKGFSRVKG